ncbi:SGNH/GDSL hydrolase family protein [Chitinophaga qingshengii]|uniref:SGNH/GDSL hydrolase family protein n=1 Tax=Chitinophaga qingshengii TaxID=1569794 RepID=A0ABR7TRF1_9BACT|nr:SGNH/GDSL hydrolase family protein [Chitinophaga qingshengii]MBC9932142.1 SGNH/GDSL hydrolase family protein [Chitinophaga qingshengii]
MKKLLQVLLLCAVLPAAAQLKSETFITRYGKLDNVWHQISVRKQARVAFLGGSITNMEGWRGKTGDYLVRTYPATAFTLLNAGIPSLGSLPHVFRLQQDVLDKGQVDLLFVEAAVNDKVNGTPATVQRRALEGIIRHALTANPHMNIVLMAFVDEDKMADYRAGRVPAEVALHEELARYYHLPFINLAKEVTARIDAGEFTWKEDFKDLHPSPFGQEIYFNTIRQLLDGAFDHPAPRKMQRAKLPAPTDAFNYARGNYLDIHKATRLQGFVADESWQPTDKVHTRPGFVRVPMLVSGNTEASLELPFTGRAIGVALLSGPDAGIIRYSIDGQPEQQLDTRTQWSRSLYLPWYLLLGDNLSTGTHTLKITTTPGSVCRIVHFLVNR